MNNTTRDINGTLVLFDLYSSTTKIICYSVTYGFLCSFALIGNTLVLMVVFMNKSMRTTINVLLVNLSISDILYVLFSAPGYLAGEICNHRWLPGLGMAVISQLFAILSPAASVFTLMAIAFERYFAIMDPLRDRARNRKGTTTILALFAIWICSVAFALPLAIGTELMTIPLQVEEDGQVASKNISFLISTIDVDIFRVYYLVIFIGLHVFPFVLLGILYVRIAWRLWHPDKKLANQPDGSGGNDSVVRRSERNRRRTTIMVIVVLVAFFICFFPFHIYFLNELFKSGYESKPSDVTSILRVLLLVNSAVNPVIYNLLSENFRAGFRDILSCCSRKKQETSVASVDTLQSVGNS